MQHYTYGIVGFGISGQLALCELLHRGVPPTEIVVIDETFLGGDLATTYGSVLSNTQWWKTKQALERYLPHSKEALEDVAKTYAPEHCTPVRIIAKACLATALLYGDKVTKRRATVTSYTKTEQGWQIPLSPPVVCKILILCTGGVPKTLPLDLPSIPLPIALDPDQLKHHVTQQDTVVVFGTSHSGILVLDALLTLGVKTIGVHKGTRIAEFADEGAYSGLKEKSAELARTFITTPPPNLSFISWNEPLELHKALLTATRAVYATGFQQRVLSSEGSVYNDQTAELQPNLYGFGLGYPGATYIDGKRYEDVSVLSFQEQLDKCLPELLRKNTSSS
jgi:hypothetical protein